MPIGLVSDHDLEKELASFGPRKNVVPSVPQIDSPEVRVEIMERPGRSSGDNNVPESLRKIISEDALLNGRSSALGLAEQFGISSSSVSAYTKGATSTATYNAPSKSISSFLTKSRNRAIRKAGKTLNAALGAITQEKLDYTEADKLSGIAKDMSVIIKNLEPASPAVESSGAATPQFVIFAPTFRQENSFDSITVVE